MSQIELFREGEDPKAWKDFVKDGIDTRPRKWVVVHNEVVLARVDWTIQMNRIFAMLVSQISMDQDEFHIQQIQVKHLQDLAKISSNNIHEEIANAAQRLVREPIEFRAPDHHYDGYPIFAVCRYLRNEGVVEAEFNEKARPYLLQLRKSFTKYKLEEVMKLSTSYAVRIYQIAKMIERDEGHRVRSLDLSDFRKLFMLENKYDRHTDLKGFVIEPAVEEINKKTSTRLQIKTVRKGESKYGKPLALRWKVWPSSKSIKKIENEKGQCESRRVDEPVMEGKHDNWFRKLPEDKQNELRERARQKAVDNGRDPDGAGFQGFVRIHLAELVKKTRRQSRN